MSIQHRAAVVDRLITEWGLHPGDVIATHIYPTDAVVYLRAPIEGVEWRATPQDDGFSYTHKTIREDMDVTVIAWASTQEAAA